MWKKIALSLAGILLLARCTSTPELEKYPRADIDRPFTLNHPVAKLNIPVPLGYYEDNSGSSTTLPIPLVSLQTSLSDKWNLLWSPFPLGALYQIARTDTHVVGLAFGASLGYSSSSQLGFLFAPAVSLFYRQKLTPTIGWEIRPGASGAVFSGTRAPTWALDLDTGPVFQLTPVFALRLRAELSWSDGRYYLGTTPSSNNGNSPRLVLPLSISSVWSITRQWDLNLRYAYSSIGYDNGFRSHTGYVMGVYYF